MAAAAQSAAHSAHTTSIAPPSNSTSPQPHPPQAAAPSASTPHSAEPTDGRDPPHDHARPELTSFGFLKDEQDEEESAFALTSLFSKVRSALGAAAYAPASPAPHAAAASRPSGQADTAGPSRSSQSPASGRKQPRTDSDAASTSRRAAVASPAPGSSRPRREHSRSPELMRRSSPHTGSGSVATSHRQPPSQDPVPKDAPAATSSTRWPSQAGAPSLTGTDSVKSATPSFPFKLRSLSRPLAVTSTTAAHAVPPRRTNDSQSSVPAQRHIDEDGSEAAHTTGADDEDEADVLSALMRRSGVALSRKGGTGGHAKGPYATGTNAALAAAAWSSVPGFPLSKDILADDTHSLRSASSFHARSELNSESHIPTSSAARAHAFGSSARAGLTTSAEAFRRMRDQGGLSRQFWMPDESVSECRGCGSTFTSFRRKHHCRLDGLIYCGRCAPAIVSGRRFGLGDELVRVCTFCRRMLSEYDRAAEGHEVGQNGRTRLLRPRAISLLGRSAAAAATDSRPGTPSAADAAAAVRPDKQSISAPLETQSRSPQSQFAANRLFAKASALPSSLSISRLAGISLDEEDSQAFSSDDDGDDDNGGGGPPERRGNRLGATSLARSPAERKTTAPFRKGLGDEDRALDPEVNDDGGGGGGDEDAGFRKHRGDDGLATPQSHDDGAPKAVAPMSATQTPGKGMQASEPVARHKAQKPARASVSTVSFPSVAADAHGASSGDDTPSKLHLVPDARSRLLSEGGDARARLVSEAARRAFKRSALRRKATQAGEPDPTASLQRPSASRTGSDEPGVPPFMRSQRRSSAGLLAHAGNGVPHEAFAWGGGEPLCSVNLRHVEAMLTQCIERSRLPNAWHDILFSLTLSVLRAVRPRCDAGELGFRRFVKVKRIPGGLPRDSQHVVGVVVSKNVATKRMAQWLPLSRPRILVVAFSLDLYAGTHHNFLSLDRVEKEQEYTRLLVARIVQLRPNVVVIKDSVSRMVIQLLEDAGITVVWSVKETALQAISRACDADIITSLDRLALDPRMGRCQTLSVDTYEHSAYPQARKSYMRFTSPPGVRDAVCTVVLRGGSEARLARVKAIMELMLDVGYHLRLEERLAHDEGVEVESVRPQRAAAPVLPADDALWASILDSLRPFETAVMSSSASVRIPPPWLLQRMKTDHLRLFELSHGLEPGASSSSSAGGGGGGGDGGDGVGKPERLTPPTATSEEPEKLPGAEATVSRTDAKAPPTASSLAVGAAQAAEGPADAKKQQQQQQQQQHEDSQADAARDQAGHFSPGMALAALGDGMASTSPVAQRASGQQGAARNSAPDPKSAATTASPVPRTTSHISSANAASLGATTKDDALQGIPEELYLALPKHSAMERETEFKLTKMEHEEQLQRWHDYVGRMRRGRGGDGDEEGASLAALASPFEHQKLVVLASTISTATRRPCTGPNLRTMRYYGEGDEAVGKWLERACSEGGTICGVKGCGKPRGIQHFSIYVHNGTRVLVVQERFVCPIPGQENTLLMWSYCKICERASPVIPLSPEAACLSFAKYLEAHFYSTARNAVCGHSYYRDHIRFFAYQNLALRFHTDPVDVRELIVPQKRLVTRPDSDARVKRDEACTLARRLLRYFESVQARLAALRHEASICRDVVGMAANTPATLDSAAQRADAESRELLQTLVALVRNTPPTDILALNSMRRRVQDAVVRWDREFAEMEKAILPPERDVRRLTASHLSRLFSEKEPIAEMGSGESGGGSGIVSGTLTPAPEMDEAMASASGSEQGGRLAGLLANAMSGGSQLGSSQASGQVTPTSAGTLAAACVAPTSDPSHDGSGSGIVAPPDDLQASVDTKSNTGVASAADLQPEVVAAPAGLSSPAMWRERRMKHPIRSSKTTEDSSCTETDADTANQVVSHLVRRFDGPAGRATPIPIRGGAGAATGDKVAAANVVRPSAADLRQRPPLRRGHTDEAASTSRNRPHHLAATGAAHESDGVLSEDEARRKAPGFRSQILARPGRVPRRTKPEPSLLGSQAAISGASSSVSASPEAQKPTPLRPGIRRAPPSSFRPPRASGNESDGSIRSSRVGAGRVHSGRSEVDEGGSSAGAGGGPSSRPTPRRTVSARSVSRGGGGGGGGGKAPAAAPRQTAKAGAEVAGTRSKVSTIARHFDRLHRDAQKERERHRQIMAIRARRAQPIASARARVDVFSNVREAFKDDEDEDEDGDESGSCDGKASSGDEASDEADSDAEALAQRDDNKAEAVTKMPMAKAAAAVLASGSAPVPPTETSASIAALDAEAAHGPGSDRTPAPRGTEAEAEGRKTSGTATPNPETKVGRGLTTAAAEATLSALSSTLPSSWRSASLLSENEGGGGEKGSLFKTLSSLWGRSRVLPLLEYPQGANEHLFADSRVVVREDEPSSLIAFTLSSSLYQQRLDSLRAQHAAIDERPEKFAASGGAGADADADASSTSSWDVVDVQETASLEAALRRPEGTHLRFGFESGGCQFAIRTLYTEQFDALRRLCGCEHSFITSLSRCVRWDSSGGKSGAAFLKTKDDRLVIKQLSRAEVEAFSSNAPRYFRYMAETLLGGKSSTLAKILGCFRLHIRSSQTGKTIKLDCIVMEHLFYGRRMSRLFDLKGSLRNRHVRETGRADEVLLDENLVEISGLKPLLVREHSKRLLRAALWNDSLFLAETNVMDYSLVVGLDSERSEMVVGIIDYVRPYDLTKRAESWLKEAVGGGQEPTIITPSAYRMRFLHFLDAIICLSPSPWIDPAWKEGPMQLGGSAEAAPGPGASGGAKTGGGGASGGGGGGGAHNVARDTGTTATGTAHRTAHEA